MTFYVQRPGQEEGEPVGEPGQNDFGSVFAMEDEWALYLPHQCDAWEIATGDREFVLAEAKAFRAELDQAIERLEQAGEAT